MGAILCIFLCLAVFNNWGCVRYLLGFPSAFSGQSAEWILARDILPVAEALLFFSLARGLGFGLLRKLLSEAAFARSSEQSAAAAPMEGFAFGLGLGSIASAVFLLGLSGSLSGAALSLLCASAALMAWPEYRKKFASRRLALPAGSDWMNSARALPFWKAAGIALFLYIGWHVLILALASPTEWDVLAYHLAIPKLYWIRGRVQEIPWLVHSHWPHLMEALYVLPLALGRDNLAALIHASACAVLVFAVFRVAQHLWGRAAAWPAALLLASQPVALRFSGTAHSDGALALFYFAASMAVWNWISSGSRRWLALGGILAGFCAGAKLHGIILAALLAAQILYAARRAGQGWSRALRPAGLFFCCGICVVLPWYLKTWAWTGNPIWPFLPGVFGGRWGAAAVTAAPPHAGSWAWLFAPELLFHDGPQFLLVPAVALTLLALSARRNFLPTLLRFLMMPLLPYLAAVSMRDSAWRYCWPFYPALALAAGWAASQLWNPKRRLASGLVLMLLGFGLWPAVRATQNNQLFEALGLRSRLEPQEDPRSAYLERSLGIYRFCRSASRDFPSAKVLLFREIRGYFLDADYMWGDPTNQGLIQYSKIRDSRELGQELARLNITHVWVNEGLGMYGASPDYYTPRILDLMDGLLRSSARPVLRDGPNTLYELPRGRSASLFH